MNFEKRQPSSRSPPISQLILTDADAYPVTDESLQSEATFFKFETSIWGSIHGPKHGKNTNIATNKDNGTSLPNVDGLRQLDIQMLLSAWYDLTMVLYQPNLRIFSNWVLA